MVFQKHTLKAFKSLYIVRAWIPKIVILVRAWIAKIVILVFIYLTIQLESLRSYSRATIHVKLDIGI